MANQGISHVLQEFKINQPEDYHRLNPGVKKTFATMLHGALKTHSDHAMRILHEGADDGIKMHFEVPSTKGAASNLPSEIFLRKICIYSTKVAITFPFREAGPPAQNKSRKKHPTEREQPASAAQPEHLIYFGNFDTERTGYGGEVREHGSCHHLDSQEFDVFIQFLCTTRKFIEHGILHVIPSYHPEARRLKTASRGKHGFLSANFDNKQLLQQFEEQGVSEDVHHELAELRLCLPSLANVSTAAVIQIREQDEDYFNHFQKSLRSMIADLSKTASEERLLGKMKEINDGLVALHKRLVNQRPSTAKDWIQFVSILLRAPIENSFIPLIGGVASALELANLSLDIRARSKKGQADELRRDSDLFLMWHLQHPKYRLPAA